VSGPSPSDFHEPNSNAPFDSAHFRRVLGHFPTGVVVITAVSDRQPVGIAIGSFSSVSLEPPLVGFFAAKYSTTWPKIRDAGVFCVNVLAEDQEELCRNFAVSGGDKFRGVGWRPGATGSPIIHDVLAWIDCGIEQVHEAGDHDIVVGRVREMDVQREGTPLVFFRGGYGRFAL
jgi:3-hydroxy-9,10-secoandrosta-1,3,5(10)-triene-9,17-dione monooxygenase reductase component